MNVADVRKKSPLVLTYANFVTPQFVANTINVIGASPLMSREPKEFEDLVAIADAVVINTGTLQEKEINHIIQLSQIAYDMGKPVILDPVAVSVPFRANAITQLLKNGHVDIIRGNAAEIAWFAQVTFDSQGIDATGDGDVVKIAQKAAQATGAIIALSGTCDVVSDGQHTQTLDVNIQLLSTIVGTGDALSSTIGAFVATDVTVENVVSAMATFKLAGQKATNIVQTPGNFSGQLLDQLFVIKATEVQQFINESVKKHD
ncbi:hydroxyethylthiazole kinase [Leuconostoc litchii]|uniref:Hydroxyethylthiazole kinase n=1 Tax=Leuconostoc litchii TaxID=1981069 RepID=A0A6P2CN22_9LACO|nr:hydroxyethylthiazole kinase [Leuconostoc litchii]TYC47435.1 hydroxyethylthiazole kinase [Leuconostoc litchii]GMA69452.1 hydroxyethylthiazole kinase [Leuconostoc litchii]